MLTESTAVAKPTEGGRLGACHTSGGTQWLPGVLVVLDDDASVGRWHVAKAPRPIISGVTAWVLVCVHGIRQLQARSNWYVGVLCDVTCSRFVAFHLGGYSKGGIGETTRDNAE